MNIVSLSGGKDSTALLVEMLRRGCDVDAVVFADTGMEFDETYETIDLIEDKLGVPIERVRHTYTWDDLFYREITRGKRKGMKRGFPPTNCVSWCTRDLKIAPIAKFCKGHDVFIGIAADESHRVCAPDYMGYRRHYPLVKWGLTEADCIKICREAGVLNPLYDMGYSKLGCWCCPKQKLNDLRLLYERHPEKWKMLRAYEADDMKNFSSAWSLEELEKRFEKGNRKV